MTASTSPEDDHHARSNFVRGLVQRRAGSAFAASAILATPPKRLVQFWHDLDRLPQDVRECIASWSKLGEQGFELALFDAHLARVFIRRRLGRRYEKAYDTCYHPAMQSDYFRLCYILVEGGCYVDADDVFHGLPIEHLFNNGRLQLQPLCYDAATDAMVPPSLFTAPDANVSSWIFYFNNNPLIAPRRHPLVARALDMATSSIERAEPGALPDIQSTTGPGNLTKSMFTAASVHHNMEATLDVLRDWGAIATSRWPLSYRHDARNWRLSNQRQYRS